MIAIIGQVSMFLHCSTVKLKHNILLWEGLAWSGFNYSVDYYFHTTAQACFNVNVCDHQMMQSAGADWSVFLRLANMTN